MTQHHSAPLEPAQVSRRFRSLYILCWQFGISLAVALIVSLEPEFSADYVGRAPSDLLGTIRAIAHLIPGARAFAAAADAGSPAALLVVTSLVILWAGNIAAGAFCIRYFANDVEMYRRLYRLRPTKSELKGKFPSYFWKAWIMFLVVSVMEFTGLTPEAVISGTIEIGDISLIGMVLQATGASACVFSVLQLAALARAQRTQ